MKKTIVITGATGFVGKKLCLEAVRKGHHLRILTRNPAQAKKMLALPGEFFEWDGENAIPGEVFMGADAVIHLAGENIASQRWSAERKHQILHSRVTGTSQVVAALNRLEGGPKILVGASAIGIYGHRGDEELTEQSMPGHGFLTEVCLGWERAYQAFLGRLVMVRTGVVLGHGGALEKMLPPFRLGLGGELAGGQQWTSWVHIDDLVKIYLESVENPELTGPVNAVAPEAVTNTQFTFELARALSRPAFLPVPGIALKIAFGEMSHVILDSQHVIPTKLMAANFKFKYPQLREALMNLLRPNGQKGAYVLEAAQWVPRCRSEVFEFFGEAHNLEEITPEWLNFHIVKMSTEQVKEGTLIDYRLRIRGVPARWKTLISQWNPGKQFVDEQLEGPYRYWHHTHSFEDLQGGTLMMDQIVYKAPLGVLGDIAREIMIKNDVRKIFGHRQKVVDERFS